MRSRGASQTRVGAGFSRPKVRLKADPLWSSATCCQVGAVLLAVWCTSPPVAVAQNVSTAKVSVYSPNVIDRILAVVSGGLILQSDVTAAMRLGLVTVPAEGDRVQGALDRLIERRLMLVEVDRNGPPEPPRAEVDAALEAIDKRIASGTELDAILRESGFTVDQLRLYVRDDLRIRAYLQQRFGTALTAAEEDILAYYRTHTRDYTREGVVRPFSEVREEARQSLLAERRAGLIREWLASLRRRTEVIVLYLPGR